MKRQRMCTLAAGLPLASAFAELPSLEDGDNGPFRINRETFEMARQGFEVVGSGFTEVNGLYRPAELPGYAGPQAYKLRNDDASPKNFWMFRWHRTYWFIMDMGIDNRSYGNIPGEGLEEHNQDYYVIPSDNDTPPLEGWKLGTRGLLIDATATGAAVVIEGWEPGRYEWYWQDETAQEVVVFLEDCLKCEPMLPYLIVDFAAYWHRTGDASEPDESQSEMDSNMRKFAFFRMLLAHGPEYAGDDDDNGPLVSLAAQLFSGIGSSDPDDMGSSASTASMPSVDEPSDQQADDATGDAPATGFGGDPLQDEPMPPADDDCGDIPAQPSAAATEDDDAGDAPPQPVAATDALPINTSIMEETPVAVVEEW